MRRVAAPVAAVASAVAGGCSSDDHTTRQPPTDSARAMATTTAERPAATSETTRAERGQQTADGIRVRGNGDATLAPIGVPSGGTILRWRNRDAVFSLFGGNGTLVDSVAPRGRTFLPAGVHTIEVIASGGWALEIPRGRVLRER